MFTLSLNTWISAFGFELLPLGVWCFRGSVTHSWLYTCWLLHHTLPNGVYLHICLLYFSELTYYVACDLDTQYLRGQVMFNQKRKKKKLPGYGAICTPSRSDWARHRDPELHLMTWWTSSLFWERKSRDGIRQRRNTWAKEIRIICGRTKEACAREIGLIVRSDSFCPLSMEQRRERGMIEVMRIFFARGHKRHWIRRGKLITFLVRPGGKKKKYICWLTGVFFYRFRLPSVFSQDWLTHSVPTLYYTGSSLPNRPVSWWLP